MKNKQTTTYKWAYLPFVFSSATILATQVMAAPGASQQYQDAKEVNTANYEYVGGNTQIGFGVTNEGDVSVDLNQVISDTENSSTSAGLWAGFELKGDDKGIKGRGVQVNHNWVSRDNSGVATRVNKVFGAYDRNEAGHAKATVGYGQENESLFWEGHVSKGLSDRKKVREVNGKTISDVAYDYGVGASVGTFLKDSNMRVRAGLDHEWGDDLGEGESTAKNTTLSAGIEKFFQGTPHSLGLDVAASKRSGGYGEDTDDTDVTGKLSYRYDFGGASIYQPDRRYRRVRVEVPGTAVAPRYANKAQFKRVPTYKTVTTYGKKTVRTPYKQLVKSTMELEGQTFFKLNSSRLIPSAKTRLLQIAAQIRKNGYKGSIRITGNTCGLGDAAYDQRLSEQRANEVKSFLIENGFNSNHLIARGLGKGHPKYPNTQDQGFKNRRVDIEYVTERKAYKTGYKTEEKRVKTGTRQVATGFKNVPAGHSNVLIDNGRPGTPRVIWKTEVIPSSPAWVKRALHNNIRHNTTVNTYQTTAGSNIGGTVNAANDIATTPQGQAVVINVLNNDDNDASITRIVTQPANGTATIVNGQIRYTPAAGFTGTDTFTYEVRDPQGNTTTANVTVTVTPSSGGVNAANDTATTPQGQAVTVDVLSNDDSDASITRVVTQPTNGTARILNGKIVYTPRAGFTGTDTFTYEVRDPQGNTTTATVTVAVTGSAGNSAPNAADDSKDTAVNQAVTISVLGNDSDPDGDTLTVSSFTQGSNGTVTRGANGQLIYTPSNGFTGTDTFTYTISDGKGGTDTATVTVNIGNTAGNSAPDAVRDSRATGLNQPVTINVLGNDTDPDGDTLRVSSFTQGSNGTVTRGANGRLIYAPRAGFTGTDTFSYTITDGNGGSDTTTVTVNVGGAGNSAPNAADDSRNTAVNQSVTIGVLGNDSDPDGDTLTVSGFTQGSNGTVTRGANGQLIYTPSNGFTGTDTFTYTISDGKGGTDTATVTVNIGNTAGNSAPDAVRDSRTTGLNQPVTINVLGNDTDPDGDTLSVSSFTQGSNGTVTRGVNGRLIYTPRAGFTGTDTFSYTITDGNGGSDTTAVTVNVGGAGNSAPSALDDSDNTVENQPVTINVLGNDSDPDGDTITVTSFTQGSNGTVTRGANGRLIYTPRAGFTGTDTFTYTVSDGKGGTDTATVTVNVGASGGNSAPNAADDTKNTVANQATVISVLGNDTDPDGDTLTVTSFTQGSNGAVTRGSNGQLIYTPRAGFTGTDTFTYTVSDGKGGTDTATVTVNVAGSSSNSAPDAARDSRTTRVNQAVTIAVLANDTDPDGDTLSVSSFTQGSNGTVTRGSNGQLIYTPRTGFTGTDTFRYTITDGKGGSDTTTVTVNVAGSGGNSAPVATDDSSNGAANQAVTVNVLANDTDADGDTLTILSFTQGSNGSVTRGANGRLIYTPVSGFSGTDTFTYTVSDGNGGTDTATVTVNIAGSGSNSAPDAVRDARSTPMNQSVTVAVLANDTDPDGDVLAIKRFTQGSNGTVTQGANGQLIYTPKAGFTGTDTFTYTVTDGKGGSDATTVTITVGSAGGNSAPDAVHDARSTPVNQAVTIGVLANDTDPDGDVLTIKRFTQGSNGTVTQGGNGQLIYTPKAGFIGRDTFTYTITDGKGGSDATTVTITVGSSGGNSAPDAVRDASSTPMNQAVTIGVLANDTDPDGDVLAIQRFTQGSNGTVTQGANGQLIYTPKTGFTGSDTFTYTITDGKGGSDTTTVTVTVGSAGGNSAPNAIRDTSSTVMNQAVTVAVLANDTDPDGDVLAIKRFTQGSNGTVTQGANGQLIYTPKTGFTGTDTFTYTVTDGKGGSDATTVTVTVGSAGGNSTPNAIRDTSSTPMNQAVTIAVLANDTDPDGDTLTIKRFTQGSNGTITQGANGQLIYTPKAGFTGTDTFTYTISDGKGGSDSTTVTVTVGSAGGNSAPNAIRDTSSTVMNQAVTVAVLANDTDPDGDVLAIQRFTQGSNGTVTQGANGQLIYTPKTGFTGTDTFTYTVTDGKGGSDTTTVTVTVGSAGGNSAPNAIRDTSSTPMNQAVTIAVLANDTDPDGDTLTIKRFTQGANGTITQGANGQLIYTPKTGFTGTDTFTYTVSDGKGGSDSTTVTVTVGSAGGNSAPNAIRDTSSTTMNQAVTIAVLANDTDPDGDTLTIKRFTQGSNGTVTQGANGQLIYTPKAGFVGRDTFTYTITDGKGGSDATTVTVDVTGGSTDPVATDDTASTGCSAVTINVLDNDTGNGNLSIIGIGNTSLGKAVISGNTIVYTPSSSCSTGNTGTDAFTYTIKDGHGNTATGRVSVDVNGQSCNVCIKAEPDDTFTDEGKAVTIDVLANDAGTGLVITSVDTPANGTAVRVGNSIRYTPDAGFTGLDSFWYDISDSKGNQDAARIYVYVGGD